MGKHSMKRVEKYERIDIQNVIGIHRTNDETIINQTHNIWQFKCGKYTKKFLLFNVFHCLIKRWRWHHWTDLVRLFLNFDVWNKNFFSTFSHDKAFVDHKMSFMCSCILQIKYRNALQIFKCNSQKNRFCKTKINDK